MTEAHNWQERRLGRTILKTYRTTVDLDDIEPNPNQPRLGPKEDEELQRQIEANEGLFEPLLLEPHPNHAGKFRIIDGDRRWTNSNVLVAVPKKESYRKLPAEITDRTLTDEERLRVWIYIHRQRKEWDAKEKEMVAYRLVDLLGRASAANILGITVRELDKLVDLALQRRRVGEGRLAAAALGRGERNPQRTSPICHHLTTAPNSRSGTARAVPYITKQVLSLKRSSVASHSRREETMPRLRSLVTVVRFGAPQALERRRRALRRA